MATSNGLAAPAEESDTAEQLIGGIAVGMLAVGVGYSLGQQKTCPSDGAICKKGEPDPWGPIIGASYGGGGVAVAGLGVAVLSESYRVGGLSAMAGGVIGLTLAAFTWKRKHVDLGFTRPAA